jgi:ornithine decarboxylase
MDKPRFLISRSGVLERYGWISGICPNISFSIKTNPEVGKVLEEETDCFFSIHTPEGLGWVKNIKRVWYLAEGISKGFFSELIGYGLRNFVIDNEQDLENLVKALEESGQKIDLLLRMRFQETTVYKGRYFLFGMVPDQINKIITELRGYRNISKLGIHFHRKTQNTGNWSLKDLLEQVLTQECLEKSDIMNIGGGIPVDYKNSRASNLDYILEKIREVRNWLDGNGIEMWMEPGRPIAAPPVRLETQITSIWGRHITVNASVYNTSLDSIIIPHKLLVEGEGEGESYLIKGSTPCSMDIFRYDVRLKSPRVGERICFLNAGGYNFPSSFCNLERVKSVVVD